MYQRSVAGVEAHLWRHSTPGGYAFIAERAAAGHFDFKQDHLVCFMAGVLALGSHVAPTPALAARQLRLGQDLADTCIRTYEMTATGLAPEITRFPGGGDPVVDAGSKHNLLRPETVESLFVLFRVTGDQRYRDAGWRIFEAFNAHCRVAGGGYSTLRDVTVVPAEQSDQQESFWLAETLKYLYLLFSDSETVPLDRWVFNTEAHPLPVFGSVPAPLPDWAATRARLRLAAAEA
jgi:mannosyl-oligosaccharide alpha-1,2-mannosidase